MSKSSTGLSLTLYTGPHCELCEHAQAVYEQLSPKNTVLHKVNIRDHSDLYHLYALRIPVLKRSDTGAELGWPFDIDMLEQFLA
ncbi:glutaredoxin family protein [Glaciecola siphonariae]|uniref:Glutaredoxin family protein n=1 Tax=Glaciecola siphonariae TaxID=521012 RepID=A0ABV9LTY0_9ALTE